MCSEDHQAGSGREAVPWTYSTGSTGFSVLKQVADCLGCNLCSQSRGAMSERDCIVKPHTYCPHQRKQMPPDLYILPCLTGNSAPLKSHGTAITYVVHSWPNRCNSERYDIWNVMGNNHQPKILSPIKLSFKSEKYYITERNHSDARLDRKNACSKMWKANVVCQIFKKLIGRQWYAKIEEFRLDAENFRVDIKSK